MLYFPTEVYLQASDIFVSRIVIPSKKWEYLKWELKYEIIDFRPRF